MKDELQKAGLSLEGALAARIRAYKPAVNPHEYSIVELFKVCTRVLPLRCSSPKVAKRLPKFIGPEIVAAWAICLKLPNAYVSTHDLFSVHNLRPWLHARERRLELDHQDVVVHPTLNEVVYVQHRKRYGRASCSAEPLDIPAQYLVVHVDGTS